MEAVSCEGVRVEEEDSNGMEGITDMDEGVAEVKGVIIWLGTRELKIIRSR